MSRFPSLIAKSVLGALCFASCNPVWSQLSPSSSPEKLPGGSVLSGQSPLAPAKGAGVPSASKLTPEERQARLRAKQEAKDKAEELRMTTYGMISPEDQAPLAVAFKKASDNLVEAIANYSEAHARIQHRLKEDLPEGSREKWLERLRESNESLKAYRQAAATLYASDPEKYTGVGALLREMLISDGKSDRLDHWLDPAKILVQAKSLADEEVLLNAGYVGLIEGDFDFVKQTWGTLEASGKLGPQEATILSEIDEIKESWVKELARREEDKSKNNPQVRIQTTKGDIIVELFEDDAPESVKNFIYLVEQGYYTRKPFFFVKEHLLAQTGCEKGDGKGNAGFGVQAEANLPTRRSHFRGSLAMPVGVNNDPALGNVSFAGSQFYFAYLPLPPVDDRNAVFGRIISGIEVIGLFKPVDLTDEEARKDQNLRPDTVIRAQVVRKRDHEYKPTPVVGRLPR